MFAILISLLLPTAMFGQTFFGSVVGTITDTSNASVPGAKVTIADTATNEEHTVTTSGTGEYQFLNLVPGNYRISVQKDGFERLVRDGVTVAVQSEVRVDGSLTVGTASQTVEVSAEVAALDTESAAVSAVVDSAEIDGLSQNGRNVMNLIGLSNGVVPQTGSQGSPLGNTNGGSATAFGDIGAYTIGGGGSNQSATLLDGAPLNIAQGNETALVPIQDAVQEFRVATNSVDAEFGRFSGGVVNLTTKSGTNGFHGGLYEFFRNNKLNANPFFNNASGTSRPEWNQNQYGANLGGPIKKNKLFFYGGWENFIYYLDNPEVESVPTAAFRNGDFSGAGVPKIYDPATVCGVPGNNSLCGVSNGSVQYLRQPFPGNIIPPSRISPYAQYVQLGYSLPNYGPSTALTNNYVENEHVGGPEHQYNGRGDYTLSDKQRLFARYTYWSVYQLPGHPFAPPARVIDVGSVFKFETHQAVLGDNYILSPTTVLGVRASFLRNSNGSVPGSYGQPLDNYGPGFAALLAAGQIDGDAPPGNTIQNYSQGLAGFTPQIGRNNLYTLAGDMTKITGRHTIKIGGESRDSQSNNFIVNAAGSFSYTSGFTAQNALSSTGSGEGYASFLLGLPSSGSTKRAQVTANAEHYSAAYITDTFQVNRKLTLTGGLRWDLPGSYTERYNRIAYLEPNVPNPAAQATGLPLLGSIGVVDSSTDPYRSVYAPHYKLFDPRLGLAYRLTSTWVARLGYAIAFSPNDNNLPNANQVNSATTTYVASLNGNITPATFNFLGAAGTPYPTGTIPAPGRNLAGIQTLTLGQSVSLPLDNTRYPYVQQWNVTIGKDLHHGMTTEVSYAGSKGTHLTGSQNLNQLPDQYDSMGQALLNPVTNPFASVVSIGSLSSATTTVGQLLRPYPEYTGFTVSSPNNANSTYNSLQTHFQKRFGKFGDTVTVNYTWSKQLDTAAVQDSYVNPGKALSASNAAERLVVSYVYDLPFGHGRALLSGAPAVVNHIVSGWGVNGVTTVQSGQPLSITYGGTNSLGSFGAGGIRPNVVAGCNPNLPGSWVEKLNSGEAFNTACYTPPASSFSFGDEASTDPHLRGQGITNFDLAAFRKFTIHEHIVAQFRLETFNLANHTRFNNPGTSLGTSTFGVIGTGTTSQQNTPRVMQLALRINF